MPKPLRYIEPDSVQEITIRTMQSRFLLRPSRRVNELILGVMAKAQRHYAVPLHGYAVLSNHITLLVTAPDAPTLADFMGFIDSNIAREVGRRHQWREKFWGRNYRSIPVVDPESQVKRMAYLLGQGCKEGLVATPYDWPGVHCARALVSGEPDVGLWIDRTRAYRLRRRAGKVSQAEVSERLPVLLSPLPVWADRSPEAYQRTCKKLIQKVVERSRQLHHQTVGRDKILRQSPHAAPPSTARSPAPSCHASSRATFMRFRKRYWEFVRAYRTIFGSRWVPRTVQHLGVSCFTPVGRVQVI